MFAGTSRTMVIQLNVDFLVETIPMTFAVVSRALFALGIMFPYFLHAETVSIEASFDRWNYPFNASPGSRLNGTIFGAVGDPSFDDHDAQILLGFETSGIPTNAHVNAITVSLTTQTANSFEYDPTYDSYTTYTDLAADTDPGRPVELYGAGFRNGFLFPAFGPSTPGPVAFEEAEAFVFGNPAAQGVRNAFMSDYEGGPRDVSNNVEEGFENSPWAVGTILNLAAGAPVPINSLMQFELDLSDPDVLSYVQRGLGSGGLFFTVASMHSSTQGSNAGIPSFFLGDPNLPALDLPVGQLSIDYQIVPEPGNCFSLLGALGLMLLIRRKR